MTGHADCTSRTLIPRAIEKRRFIENEGRLVQYNDVIYDVTILYIQDYRLLLTKTHTPMRVQSVNNVIPFSRSHL